MSFLRCLSILPLSRAYLRIFPRCQSNYRRVKWSSFEVGNCQKATDWCWTLSLFWHTVVYIAALLSSWVIIFSSLFSFSWLEPPQGSRTFHLEILVILFSLTFRLGKRYSTRFSTGKNQIHREPIRIINRPNKTYIAQCDVIRKIKIMNYLS